MQARFFAGDYESAVDLSLRARRLLWTSPSLFETAEYHFYSALARAALCDAKSSDKQGGHFQPRGRGVQLGQGEGAPLHHSSTPSLRVAGSEDEDDDSLPDEALPSSVGSSVSERSRENEVPTDHFEALTEHHRQLALWAQNCPENFETRVALVSAEIARIEGRVVDAEGLYEQAMHSAHVNGFVHNEALANELVARFFAERGFEKIGRMYLRDARYCYLRWGATGKVRQLEELYPRLREEEPEDGCGRRQMRPEAPSFSSRCPFLNSQFRRAKRLCPMRAGWEFPTGRVPRRKETATYCRAERRSP
jgi:hypothetical protein